MNGAVGGKIVVTMATPMKTCQVSTSKCEQLRRKAKRNLNKLVSVQATSCILDKKIFNH